MDIKASQSERFCFFSGKEEIHSVSPEVYCSFPEKNQKGTLCEATSNTTF
jgi:hypothetical protein